MANNSTCSDNFPSTAVYYTEISSDVLIKVFLSTACVLAVICIGIFIEELVFLQKIHNGNEPKVRKVATILGLYPVTIITSVISLLVPTSTLLLDFIASCYLSVCFYTFVTLTIDYFGGEKRMLEILSDHKVKLNTPPCCCCCCCILKPIILSKRSLLYLKLFTMQVTVFRPILVFISVVLWTDGKYVNSLDPSSSYIYITIITAVSTMLSMYGTIVIVRGSRFHLKQYSIWLKFWSFKFMLVLINLQHVIFAVLAVFDLPACIGTRGTKVRGSGLQHSILVIESFLLTLLARKAYRVDETNIERPISSIEAGHGPKDEFDKHIMGDKSVNILGGDENYTDTFTSNNHDTVKCSGVLHDNSRGCEFHDNSGFQDDNTRPSIGASRRLYSAI